MRRPMVVFPNWPPPFINRSTTGCHQKSRTVVWVLITRPCINKMPLSAFNKVLSVVKTCSKTTEYYQPLHTDQFDYITIPFPQPRYVKAFLGATDCVCAMMTVMVHLNPLRSSNIFTNSVVQYKCNKPKMSAASFFFSALELLFETF